jgi:hypothetical protein
MSEEAIRVSYKGRTKEFFFSVSTKPEFVELLLRKAFRIQDRIDHLVTKRGTLNPLPRFLHPPQTPPTPIPAHRLARLHPANPTPTALLTSHLMALQHKAQPVKILRPQNPTAITLTHQRQVLHRGLPALYR